MRGILKTLAAAGGLALALNSSAVAQDKIEILTSVPGLTFPFFVHMMNAMKTAVEEQGGTPIESDGQAAKPLPQQARDIARVVQSVDSCREEVKGFSRVSDGGLQPGERG